MKGYRNMLVFSMFLAWCLMETWIVLRAAQVTADLVTALGVLFTGMGGVTVGVVFGRGYNKGKVVE